VSEFWYGVLEDAMLFVDRINFEMKSQHKLQFIRSKYLVKSAKSRHLVKITTNDTNHGNNGFRDFLLSLVVVIVPTKVYY